MHFDSALHVNIDCHVFMYYGLWSAIREIVGKTSSIDPNIVNHENIYKFYWFRISVFFKIRLRIQNYKDIDNSVPIIPLFQAWEALLFEIDGNKPIYYEL